MLYYDAGRRAEGILQTIKEQVKQINKHVIPHNEEVKDDKSTAKKIAETNRSEKINFKNN